MALARRPELIVGKLKPVIRQPQADDEDDEEAVEQPLLTSWLPGVCVSDLEKCSGLYSDAGYNEAWICADDVIYNVTSTFTPRFSKLLHRCLSSNFVLVFQLSPDTALGTSG